VPKDLRGNKIDTPEEGEKATQEVVDLIIRGPHSTEEAVLYESVLDRIAEGTADLAEEDNRLFTELLYCAPVGGETK